ncbi:septal ring lytic transglycosylase RlpA family protein [Roseomonas sp. HJA6]|uniref:Endolytic peptidoglycan transglycosylase RlpA n=2 Tax=Roseomonas alba TaxID=2846776 RepID=A0ABS7A744_9PROT|nr:septal ring lytic transglycosylase RlpA family protein [Neoroseomonas alba]
MTIGCAQSPDAVTADGTTTPPATVERPAGQAQTGMASYYSHRFNGRRMASGAPFDPGSDTIAHRTLPFGTLVRVTNLRNGLTTTGTVQDRGPWTRGRIADLSPRIARQIDMIRSGVAQVEIVPVEIAEAPE